MRIYRRKLRRLRCIFFQSRSPSAARGRSVSPRSASVRTTWEKAYVPYLRKLQAIATQHTSLSLPEAIYATVQSTQANSRSRQCCCTALDALATFLSISLPTELKAFWGNYGSSKTQMRQLPTDEEILAAYKKIPNPAWQFVYGVMATYGLRNHEVFFCDYAMLANGDEEAAIEVLECTKTGQHDVWPFHPSWIDAFELRTIRLPKINTDLNKTTLQLIGQQVSLQFKRYEIPFCALRPSPCLGCPYDWRGPPRHRLSSYDGTFCGHPQSHLPTLDHPPRPESCGTSCFEQVDSIRFNQIQSDSIANRY